MIKLFRRKPDPALELEREKLELEKKRLRMAQRMLVEQSAPKQAPEYKAPWLPAGVVPKGKTAPVAQDSCSTIYQYAGEQDANFFPAFVGYPQLAMLSQSSDYRSVPETTATEMTRKWGKFVPVGDDENDADAEIRAEKIEALETEFKRHDIRSMIQRVIEVEMTMGRAQVFIDLDHTDTSLPFVTSPIGVKKGALRGFSVIEPIWSTPSAYNANDPTRKDFFVPERWYVMGQDVHADRLITVIMRPVPDMLKPAYNFGGISMLQLMMPYVQRYQRTADSVAELVHAFSLTILATDMSSILGGENDPNTLLRAGLFNKYRDNTGLMLLDKEAEEISQINTPLTGLPELLRQAQEQMAAPSHTPLVKLLGVTPSGLNASAEGEIEVYRDYISAQNEAHIRPVIERISELMQLSLFGEVDQSIRWEFEPLKQMDGKELAEIGEIKARTSVTLVDGGIISQEEARQTLADDPASDYSNIVVEDVPEMPEPDFGGMAMDEFREQDHPRDKDGKFTSSSSQGVNGKTQIAKGSQKSERLSYAESKGFNTETVFVHAGNSADLEEIKASGNFPGLFSLPEEESSAAESYGKEKYSFVIKGEPWGDSDIKSAIGDDWEKAEEIIRSLTSEDASDETVEHLIDVVSGRTMEPTDEAMEAVRAIDDADWYKEAQSLRMKFAAKMGASAVIMDDEFGDSTVALLPGDGVMMVDHR